MTYLSGLQPDSLLSYLVAFLLPLVDAIVPVFPSESAIVALGVATANSVDPRLLVLVGVAALGACIGDNACFALGRFLGPWVDRHFFVGDRRIRRREWAQTMLERFGARVIIACRFVPGGRTVVTFTCGVVEYPWRRFLPLSALSGLIWACYAFVIGRIGGSAFAGSPWLGLILALGIALVLSVGVGGVRRVLQWHHRVVS